MRQIITNTEKRAEKYWNKAEEYEAELNVGVSAERTEDGAVAEDSVSLLNMTYSMII